MINRNLKQFLPNAKTNLLVMVMILGIFAGAAFADEITLKMAGAPTTVPKGGTIDRIISGIPAGIPGTLRLRVKWHTGSLSFNRMVVKLSHGSTTLKTSRCFTFGSNSMSPKCDFALSISQTEANKSGMWKLSVTNNSAHDSYNLNIEKGSDATPLMPNFKSTYTPSCPSAVNLEIEGGMLSLSKGATQIRKILGIGSSAGVLRLKAKWHAINMYPAGFSVLHVELIKPNGQVAKSGDYYSIHSNKTPKLDFAYSISATDAALPGNWQLKITNRTGFQVEQFDIKTGLGSIYGAVPNFFSTYKATCN